MKRCSRDEVLLKGRWTGVQRLFPTSQMPRLGRARATARVSALSWEPPQSVLKKSVMVSMAESRVGFNGSHSWSCRFMAGSELLRHTVEIEPRLRRYKPSFVLANDPDTVDCVTPTRAASLFRGSRASSLPPIPRPECFLMAFSLRPDRSALWAGALKSVLLTELNLPSLKA